METWIENNWWLALLFVIWSLFWKGMALWRAAKQDDKIWYIALLVINTVGILEMFYLFFFSRREPKIQKAEDQ